MRLNSTISLGIAVVLGGLAAYTAKGMMQTDGAATSVAPPLRTAVVASENLPFGTPLTPDNVREVPWPSDNIPEGAVATVTDLFKEGRRVAITAIQRNEPILEGKITGPNQRATLSTLIEEGMRAVSVRVDEVRGVAGFILPADRVDVILTRGEESGGAQLNAAYADVLLQNVKVLAIDQLSNDRQEKPTVARAVTLELSVEQAQKVILAQGVGRLSLVLRQAGRAGPDTARRVTAADLSVDGTNGQNKQKSADRAAPMIAPAVPVVYPTVNVIRNAAKREQYTVARER